jgi:cytidylate kinase
VARGLAARLGLTYVDTGAMYRGVALKAQRSGVDPRDQERLTEIARQADFAFRQQGQETRLILDGEDVSDAIRRPEISGLASQVATIPGVRAALVQDQRRLGAQGGIVMEGRDIGTVVFSDAEVKIYLDASPEERARRRRGDLERQGLDTPLEHVLRDIRERDQRDSSRADSPLRLAPGATHLNTDGLTIERVIDRIAALVEGRC